MKERISQLMDGELEGQAADNAIHALRGEGEALESWRTYHLISDAMRDTRVLSAGFSARIAQRLQAEPTVLAPQRARPESRTWFALSAAASFAAVALVGWLTFAPQQAVVPPIAQTPPALAASTANDYLLAHQGFSPRVSFQGMAPYVRNVSEQGRGPGK